MERELEASNLDTEIGSNPFLVSYFDNGDQITVNCADKTLQKEEALELLKNLEINFLRNFGEDVTSENMVELIGKNSDIRPAKNSGIHVMINDFQLSLRIYNQYGGDEKARLAMKEALEAAIMEASS